MQVPRVCSTAMRLEGFLVLPRGHKGEVIRPTALLQHLKANKARVRTAGLAVLPEQCGSLGRGWWHDFDICHHVDGGITRCIWVCCLLLSHRISLPGCCSMSTVLAATGWR